MSLLARASIGAGRRALAIALLASGTTAPLGQRTFAQDAGAGPRSDMAASPRRAARPRTRHAPKAQADNGVPPPDLRTSPLEAGNRSLAQSQAASYDMAANLAKAGAGLCAGQVTALAASTMGKVAQYNTISTWATAGGESRAVSLSIGQKYPNGSAVPFGVAQVIAAPNQRGTCDGFLTQVLPSPLSCSKLHDSIVAQQGRQIGDLAGIVLMQDANGRTMLVPTAADTCVLVVTQAAYAK